MPGVTAYPSGNPVTWSHCIPKYWNSGCQTSGPVPAAV
jgi:hypothetical protein